MNHWISLLLLPALALSAPVGAEVYKCRSGDGRMEITNTPCPSGANTVKTVRDEPVSEANRQQAEREVARMRDYVEKREAAQRADEAAERQNRSNQRQTTANTETPSRSVEDCLRELDRQALQPAQRAQMEAACRGNPQPPVYVPVPVPVPAYGGNPLGNCIANVERLNLMPAERQRRISQCEGSYSAPARPVHEQERHPAPAPARTLGAPPSPCPPGSKGCARR